MSKQNWLIYGANGYTGTLLAEEAVRKGHRPILAGRSAEKLKPIADRLGLPFITLNLADAPALVRALEGVELVLHAAGPFIDTSDVMVRACLAAGTHYLDVTGEIPVFANTFKYDAEAKQRGVLLLSGVGFDVIPTDCLAAHVAAQLPDANVLEIAIAGMDSLSPGTLKSMLDGGLNGGLVRKDGKLSPLTVGKGTRTVQFANRSYSVMPIPWGDLETAYRTTGIPNITTYMAFPRQLVAASAASWRLTELAMPLVRGVLGRPQIKQAIQKSLEARVKGPDEATRKAGRSQVWARVSNPSGRSVEAWLDTLEGYQFTAVAGVRSVEKALEKRPTGALTPVLAFGRDFVLEIESTHRYDALPAEARTARRR